MRGYITNIEKDTLENKNFRKVLYTTKNSQLVIMSIKPGDDIGEEIHELDQFIRIESGQAKFILNDVEHDAGNDHAAVIPAGTKHNVLNTGSEDLKLYSIYCPPEHRDGVIHSTKSDAQSDNEHFDGQTTES